MLRRLFRLVLPAPPALALLLFALLCVAPEAWAQSAPAAPPASPAASSAASSATPSETPSPTQPELRLEDVLRQVVAANPSLVRAATLVEAQRAHVGQTGVLPDPSVTVNWMGDATPFKLQDGDPSSYRGFAIMQMLPLGRKRGWQREVARRDVAVEEVTRAAAERSLVADAKAAFFDYRYYGLALGITERNRQRLEQLAEITESRYRVGKAMQQDVLQARLQISMLLQRAATLTQQRLTSAARLNTFMGRPADAPLGAAAPESASAPLPGLDALSPLAEANDPMLAKEVRMAEREEAALSLSRKDRFPDLSVGYMVQQRAGNPVMQGAQFTVNLPSFHRERLRQEVAEGELRVRAATEAQDARRLEAAYELRQAYASAQTARQMVDLYDRAILPQAELVRDSAQSSYSVGNVDFLTVVSNYSAMLSYQLDYERQRADYRIALARIEALTGDLDAMSATPGVPSAAATATPKVTPSSTPSPAPSAQEAH